MPDVRRTSERNDQCQTSRSRSYQGKANWEEEGGDGDVEACKFNQKLDNDFFLFPILKSCDFFLRTERHYL